MPQQATFLSYARRALRTGRLALDDGDAVGATNRAYYACFYAAQAALLEAGETPKSHSGTLSRFGLHFVVSGRVPPEIGRLLSDAFTARQRSDYEAFAVTDTAAADLLADAERFVEAVRGVVT